MRTVDEDLFGDKYIQPINQKLKGNRNEVFISKIITTWAGVEFARTPSSGGYRWQNMNQVVGDVLSTDFSFDFPFTVETKDLTNLHITKQLRKNSFIYTIWQQVLRDSARVTRHPLLLLRKTGERPRDKYTIFLEKLKPVIELLKTQHIPIISEGDDIIGVNSLNFFKYVKYKQFVSAYRKAENHTSK
jgi:hypothetical protein